MPDLSFPALAQPSTAAATWPGSGPPAQARAQGLLQYHASAVNSCKVDGLLRSPWLQFRRLGLSGTVTFKFAVTGPGPRAGSWRPASDGPGHDMPVAGFQCDRG